MVGDGMVRKAVHVKQGDLCGEECRTGVRAPIVALKRGNARRARGCRKVDAPPPDRRNAQQPGTSALVAKPPGVAHPSGVRADTKVWTERMLTTPPVGVKGRLTMPPLPSWGCIPSRSLCLGRSVLSEVRPPTGEPCAGKPHARFGGGRGWVDNQPFLPLSFYRPIRGCAALVPAPTL